MSEGFPAVTNAETDPLVGHEEEYFQQVFGLGREELEQTVTFGGHTGTVAQMLTDEKCPVGSMIGQAYRQEGLAGVQEKLGLLTQMAGEKDGQKLFDVRISEQSLERENLKKK
jgi:hypothetical protein